MKYISEQEIDNIIKEDLMRGICIVDEGLFGGGNKGKKENAKSKVYPKISGLVNLGRTYFVKKSELEQKDNYAQFQLQQKFGSEIYGISAQNGNKVGDKGSVVSNSDSLISCSYKYMVTIPSEVAKESSNGYNGFKSSLGELIEQFNQQDEKFQKKYKNQIDKIIKLRGDFRELAGANDSGNVKVWGQISDILGSKEFKEIQKNNSALKTAIANVTKGYKGWSSGNGEKDGGKDDGSDGGVDNNGWNPNFVYRIDINTKFEEDWYKNKFKSGFLNKAIMAVKTAASYAADGKGHEYKKDEMEPSEKRKLDSIQWKMTNKVAKEYIKLLLGWSRKKERTESFHQIPDLVEDKSFGEKMASKALKNRGILGRLKQKIFSGGQASNVISVCFQLADPYDGTWSIVEEKQVEDPTKGVEDKDTGSEQKTNESTIEDPFMNESFDDVIVDNERLHLAYESCKGSKESLSKLIDKCLIGD